MDEDELIQIRADMEDMYHTSNMMYERANRASSRGVQLEYIAIAKGCREEAEQLRDKLIEANAL